MNRDKVAKTCALLAAAISLALLLVPRAFSHLADRTAASGVIGLDHWATQSFPIQWSLNTSTNSNIQGSRSVADVMQASFNTWLAAPNTALNASRAGDSSNTSAGFDGVNLVCFVCKGNFTDAGTLAVTMTTVATAVGASDGRGGRTLFVGQILDADILFNPDVNFNTAGGGNEDLQTVATHEVGHFFGLSHSGVVRAIMFPFAPSQMTTLSYDDVAGISTLYPAGSPVVPTTSISGTVRLNNAAVFGAHVFADSQTAADPFSGFNIRKTPIGTLTLPDGTYSIQGVPADLYRITAEPLDLPEQNGDVTGYSSAYGQGAIQTNFTTRWH